MKQDLTWPAPIYERFTLSGEDTIMNGITYKKLYIFYETTFNKSKSTCIGGIREDSSKRIFYKGNVIHFLKPSVYSSWDIIDPVNTELLLFDFSLSIGDTFKGGNLSQPDDILVVSSIDTILVGNTLRRQYSFEPIYWVKWIEGIGNVKGLLFTSGDLPFNGIDDDLICFQQNNEILYFNKKYKDCTPVISGLETLPYNSSEIIPYPNPAANGSILFQFGNNSVLNLKIFNCTGNSVGVYQVRGQPAYMLKTEKYTPGIYFYIAINKQGIGHTGKFIVQ